MGIKEGWIVGVGGMVSKQPTDNSKSSINRGSAVVLYHGQVELGAPARRSINGTSLRISHEGRRSTNVSREQCAKGPFGIGNRGDQQRNRGDQQRRLTENRNIKDSPK